MGLEGLEGLDMLFLAFKDCRRDPKIADIIFLKMLIASGHSIGYLQRQWCHLLAACPLPSRWRRYRDSNRWFPRKREITINRVKGVGRREQSHPNGSPRRQTALRLPGSPMGQEKFRHWPLTLLGGPAKTAYLSSETSSMRRPLEMLLTMIVNPFT